MDELRVNVDDLQATANRFQASAGELVGGAPVGAGLSCQASAAAVQAVHAGAGVAEGMLAARTAAAGVGVAAADASYVENEAESAAQLRALA